MQIATSMTQINVFHDDPERTSITSKVMAVRPHHFGMAVAFAENIARAAGGGEPRDVGTVAGKKIDCIEKYIGKTWIAFAGAPDTFHIGDHLLVTLDAAHRERRRRLHTALHLLIRSAYEELGCIKVVAAEITDDASAADVVLAPPQKIEGGALAAVDRRMRSEVLLGHRVFTCKSKSLDAARAEHGSLFRLSGRYALTGKVRLVVIEGFDVNPCSGLHYDTSNIGPYSLEATEVRECLASNQILLRIRLHPAWMYWYGDQS